MLGNESRALISEQMAADCLFHGPPRHQQSPCSKAFQRTLIDHLQAPDTLTTVFFPGVLSPVLQTALGPGGQPLPQLLTSQPLTHSLLVDYE